MIPDIPALRESLATLHVVEGATPPEGLLSIATSDASRRIHRQHGMIEDSTALYLTQTGDAPIALPKLIDRIGEALQKSGHAHADKGGAHRASLATQVLSLATVARPADLDPIAAINCLLANVKATRLALWAVLPAPSTGRDIFRFGDFSYGEMDSSLLATRCRRAGSDYFELWDEQSRGRRSVLRDGRNLLTIDVKSIDAPLQLGQEMGALAYRITDEYFHALATAERDVFLRDLDTTQAVFACAGLGAIGANVLRHSLIGWIAVFTRDEKHKGWVVPDQQHLIFSSTEPSALSSGFAKITDSLKLDDWRQRPLDEPIQRFCSYLMKAQELERSTHLEEALIHLVFGFDLLLGGESGDRLTDVLSERAALLAHRAIGRPMDQLIRFVRDCYDMRSGYAHRGRRGELDDEYAGVKLVERVNLLEQLAHAALGAACFARRQEWSNVNEALRVWVKRIDVLRAKLAAGMPLDENDVASLGLDRIRIASNGLPRVTLDWSSTN